MKAGSKLIRERDQKVFTVTRPDYQSDIQAEDGETDRVKWGFDNTYVSNNGSYALQHEPWDASAKTAKDP